MTSPGLSGGPTPPAPGTPSAPPLIPVQTIGRGFAASSGAPGFAARPGIPVGPPQPGIPVGPPRPTRPGPTMPSPGAPPPGQRYPGQPYPGQSHPEQAYLGQPYPEQAYLGQSYLGQPYPGAPLPGWFGPAGGPPYPGSAMRPGPPGYASTSFPGDPAAAPGHPGAPYPGLATSYPPPGYPPVLPGYRSAGPVYDAGPAGLYGPLAPADALVTLGAGQFLGALFRTAWRNRRQLLPLGLAATLPLGAVMVAMTATLWPETTPAGSNGRSFEPHVSGHPVWLAVGALITLLSVVLLPLYQGCAFHLGLRRAGGRPAGIGEAVRFAGARLLPLVGWTLAVTAPVAVLGGLPYLVGLVISAPWLAVLGLLVFLLVACPLGMVLASAVNGVVLVERQGPARIWTLTRSAFWPLLGRLALFQLVMGLATLLLQFALGLVIGLIGLAGAGPTAILVLSCLPVPAFLVLSTALQSMFPLLAYAWLRHRENPAVTAASLAAELPAPTSPAGHR